MENKYDFNGIIKDMLEYINHPISIILKDSSEVPLYIANPETLKPVIKEELELYENIRKSNCDFDKTIKKELYNYDINKPETFPKSLLDKAKKAYLENSKYVKSLKISQFSLATTSPIDLSLISVEEDVKKEGIALGKKIDQEQALNDFIKIEYLYTFELIKFKTIFNLLESFFIAEDY